MSKIEIRGDTIHSKDLITSQVTKLVKQRLLEIKDLITDLEKELEFYRKKYAMTDAEFVKRFEEGLGDDEDYFVWEGSIKVLSALHEERDLLREAL